MVLKLLQAHRLQEAKNPAVGRLTKINILMIDLFRFLNLDYNIAFLLS